MEVDSLTVPFLGFAKAYWRHQPGDVVSVTSGRCNTCGASLLFPCLHRCSYWHFFSCLIVLFQPRKTSSPLSPALFFCLQYCPPPVLGSRGICMVSPKLSALGFPPRQLLLLMLDTGSIFIALNWLELCVFYLLELEGLIYSSPEIIFISFTQVQILDAFLLSWAFYIVFITTACWNIQNSFP